MSKSKNPECGVYCYYRQGKPVYVGVSLDLHRRKLQHKNRGRFLDCDYKVLELTTTEDMFERERFWIRELNTLTEGENKVIHNNMDLPEVRQRNSERMKNNNPMKPGVTNSGSFVKGGKPIITPERNKKVSEGKKGSKNPNYGKPEVSEHLNKDKMTCEVCGVTMNKGNFIRWGHGPNCVK